MDNKWYYLLILVLIIAIAWYIPILFNSKSISDNFTELNLEYQAEKEFKADMAEITMGVYTKGNQLESIFAENNKRMKKIEDVLKELDIISYQTINYQILPIKDDDENSYKIINQLEIKTENLKEITIIIKEIVEAGANEITSINYLLSDRDKKIEEVSQMALNGIKNKIKKTSQELGYTNYKIKSLNIYDSISQERNVRLMEQAQAGKDFNLPTVIPAKKIVRVKINTKSILWQ